MRLAPALFTLLIVTVLTLLGTREARAAESVANVVLYTIGPAAELTSRFGHSFLCTRDAGKDGPDGGHCYDYGVPATNDTAAIMWSAVRNRPGFTPVKIDERWLLSYFESQGRQVERQLISLPVAQAERLASLLEDDVREKRAYAYHPYWANCATKLRDHLDTATDGKLRKGPSSIPPGTLRAYMEAGHSGHLGILMAMALWLGETNEHVPTPWEAMLLPSVLRDAVAEAFSAAPEKLDERIAVVLPTSSSIGRFALFALAFVLLAVVRISARRDKLRAGLTIVGATLGGLALSMELAAVVVKWSEVSHNWALLLFVPTDLVLPYLKGPRLALYARARIAMAIVFGVLEIADIIHQPMLPLSVFIALPMIGVLSVLKENKASAEAVAHRAAA